MIDEWRQARLGEVVNLKRGYDLPKRLRQDGPFPVVSSSGLTGTHSEFKVQPPGVVTGRYGTLGQVYFVETPMWPLNTTLYVEDFKGNVPRYVAYLLESLKLDQLVASSAVPGINRNHLHPLQVRVPDLAVQARIASALESLDALIKNNQQRIELLEEIARLLYQEWFVHFRFPDHESTGFVDSELGTIPDGWKLIPASEAIEINPRLKIGKNEECRFLSMGDLSEASMVCFPSERRRGSSGSKFQNGDTLFARITPCLENGKTGFIQCLSDGEIGRGSTEFIVLRSRRLCPEMTYLLARDERFRQNAIKSMSGASGRQRVRPECFDSFVLAEPPSALIDRFAQLTSPMFNLTAVLAEKNGVLRKARDLLLPRLVSGELDVSELDMELEAMGV